MKKFLLIDDIEIDILIHSKILERINKQFKILSKFSAFEALDDLSEVINKREESLWPDVILLDLNMPMMDGFGFLEAFEKLPQEWTSKTDIYVVSSSLDPADKKRPFQSKWVKSFIEKPLRLNYFEKVILNRE